MTNRSRDVGGALSLLRMGVGAAAWAAPGVAARMFGEAPAANSWPFVLRLFAARDFTLGLGYFGATPAQKDRLLALGMASDASDAAAAFVAHRRGDLPARLAVPFGLSAVAAVAAGAVARRKG